MKCLNCKSDFVSKTKNHSQIFCSTRCQSANWRKINPEKIKEKYKKNPYPYKERMRIWSKNKREGLKDYYIIQRLRASGIKNPTPEMIEQKRLQLKIIRKIKQLTNEKQK